MIRAAAIAAALALVAGCNPASDAPDAPDANQSDNAANVAAGEAPAPGADAPTNPAAGTDAAAAPATAEVRTATTIPAAFRGEWNADLATCRSGLNDARLRIGPRSLLFFESSADVRRVEIEDARTITIEGDFQGEGESWTRRVRLSLSPAGDALTMDQLTRQRCP